MKIRISKNYIATRKIKYKANAKINLYAYAGAKTTEQKLQLIQKADSIFKLFE